MIVRDKKRQTSAGFIQDFDYSFSWVAFLKKHMGEYGWGDVFDLATWEKYCVEHGHEEAQQGNAGNDSKERTVSSGVMKLSAHQLDLYRLQGTVFFMAVEILESSITHEARHDLESFEPEPRLRLTCSSGPSLGVFRSRCGLSR